MPEGSRTSIKLPAVLSARLIAAVAGAAAGGVQARDRGPNQPSATGNTDVGRDPGINQPGATGNVGVGAPAPADRALRDSPCSALGRPVSGVGR